LDNGALRPSAGPLFEDSVRVNRIFDTSDKALLCLLVIDGQQKREPVQRIHVIGKYLAKIFRTGVFAFFAVRDPLSVAECHISVS
jgi:hypothetical protein